MFAIMHGNPIDGLSFVGPFTTHEAAHNWADQDAHIDDHEWWIIRLEQSGDTMDYVDGAVAEPST